MRTSYWAILTAAALSGFSSAQAAPQSADAGITQVEVRGKTEYKLAPHEFDNYVGTYRFDSGDVMKVWQRGTRYYSQLNKQAAHQLQATAAGRFNAAPGATLEFSEDGNQVAVRQFDKLMVAMR